VARTKKISDDALLASARLIFTEKGAAASTREIARHAGVSEGLLFQRYRSKDELFFAAMIPPPTTPQPTPGADFEPAFRALAAHLLDYFRSAAPILAQLMTHPGFRFDDLAARHPKSAMVSLRSDLVRFLASHKSPDPSGASLLLMSSLHGIAMFERLGAYGGRFPDEFVQRSLGCLWQAVRPTADHATLAPQAVNQTS
jgi:AcrR family transcriptional regulator